MDRVQALYREMAARHGLTVAELRALVRASESPRKVRIKTGHQGRDCRGC